MINPQRMTAMKALFRGVAEKAPSRSVAFLWLLFDALIDFVTH